MLRGNVDKVCRDFVAGWACNDADFSKKLCMTVYYEGDVIGHGLADQFRSDLAVVHKEANFAYHIKIPRVQDANKLTVSAKDIDGTLHEFIVSPTSIIDKSFGYQSFSDQLGDSDSAKKLAKLAMPDDLFGQSVLDIGCNEGYFCEAALQRWAANIVGIDIDQEMIHKATQRHSEIQYINGSWWDIPEQKFDLILFLSAIHYESDPLGLLKHISEHLKPSGRLILELGVLDCDFPAYLSIARHDGFHSYPTKPLVEEWLGRIFNFRLIGPSVNQAGDSVNRFVYHCFKKTYTCILISGESGSGKTSLSIQLANPTFLVFPIDRLLTSLNLHIPPNTEKRYIYKKISQELDMIA